MPLAVGGSVNRLDPGLESMTQRRTEMHFGQIPEYEKLKITKMLTKRAAVGDTFMDISQVNIAIPIAFLINSYFPRVLCV